MQLLYGLGGIAIISAGFLVLYLIVNILGYFFGSIWGFSVLMGTIGFIGGVIYYREEKMSQDKNL